MMKLLWWDNETSTSANNKSVNSFYLENEYHSSYAEIGITKRCMGR